jgi:GH24 family phage-related lysozyme (muramidase)
MSEVQDETLEELEGSNTQPAPPEGEEDGDEAEETPPERAPIDEGEAKAGAPTALSTRGAAFVSRFEGVILRLYNDPVGHCTVGIGHLVHLGRCDGRASEAPFRNGISRERAFELLRQDVAATAAEVRRRVRVSLNQAQFDAMCSWAFNCGSGVLTTSTLVRLLNGGDYGSVPGQLARWDKAGNPPRPVAGLTRRRRAEGDLFAQGRYE